MAKILILKERMFGLINSEGNYGEDWKENLLFYEYFHGDNGAGIGASHQLGWTGVISVLIKLFGSLDPDQLLHSGKKVGLTRSNLSVFVGFYFLFT